MSGRYELLVADPAFGSTIAMLACPGPAPRTMLDVSRAPRVVADWLLTELNALLDRAEKAEARVAELEAQVAATPVVCFDCGVVGAIYDETDSAGVVRNRVCGRCGSSWQVDAKTLEIPPVKTPMRDRIPPKPAKGEVWTPKARASDCPTHGPEQTVASRWTTETIAPVRFVCLKCSWVWDDPENAKTAPQTPVPAPEGTETVQKAPPPSPVGAPRSDRGAGIKSDTQSPGPGRSDPRASESSNLDTAYPTGESSGPKVPDRIAWFATPEADAFRVYDEMLRNPGHPQRGLTTEEVDLTKPQTLRAYATFGEASPENSIRILVDPAAAAEVEARTGAYGRGLTKDEDAAYEAVLHGFMRDAMKGLDESMRFGAAYNRATPQERAPMLRELAAAGPKEKP